MFYLWFLQSYITAFRGSHGSSCELMNAFPFCFHRHWHHPQPRQFNVAAQLGLTPFFWGFFSCPSEGHCSKQWFPTWNTLVMWTKGKKLPCLLNSITAGNYYKKPSPLDVQVYLMLRSILWSYKAAGFKIPLLQRHVRAVRNLAAWLYRTCPLHCKS